MYITWLEMKKALGSPVLLILLGLMLAWNVFTMISESKYKQELRIVADIVATYGQSFDDAVLHVMDADLQQQAKQLGATDAATFYEDMTYEAYEQATQDVQQQMNHFRLLYTYWQAATQLESDYTAIHIATIKQDFIQNEQMPRWLETHMVVQFDAWQSRYDAIVATNEYKQWFFLGEYRMHSQLFRQLLKTLAMEGVLIVALLTALLMNYQFEQRTQLVVYATKKGRKLWLHQALASLLTSVLLVTSLFTVTLVMYFTVYDYSALWQTSISSGMNWEYQLPYITWWDVSVFQYFIFALTIIALILCIVFLLTCAVALYLKNSYYTWIIVIVSFVAMFVVPMFFSNSVLLWLSSFNLSLLLMNPHHYLSGGTTFMMTKYNEAWSIGIWFLFATGALVCAVRYFNRKDVL